MNFKKIKTTVSIVLLSSILFSACTTSQKVIDNILPDYNKRMYSLADLLPYTYKEIRNAQALYGQELTKFFYDNTSTKAETSRVTDEEKEAFYSELRYRNANYKLLRERLAMYIEDESQSAEVKEADRQKEYDAYYKLPTAKSASIIKQYNGGKLQGMPLMSIRVDMSTATKSEVDDLYSEAMCEIYKPVVIETSKYNKLKFGDTLDLIVPATNSTAFCSETKKVNCTYVATDSLVHEEDGEKTYYFIAQVDGTNEGYRRILDRGGKTLEIFVEKSPLQFIKYARVARANEPQRFMTSVANDNATYYDFDKLAIRALGGGYLVYDYKDYVYANSISTNLKGYITSLYDYDNQRIDVKYYDTIND